MPVVSLYCEGQATIECGRYGMTLEEAKAAFLATCEKLNLTPEVSGDEGEIEFDFTKKSCGDITFPELNKRLMNLLHEVCNVADIHADPPSSYQLALVQEIPPGEYVRTGTFND